MRPPKTIYSISAGLWCSNIYTDMGTKNLDLSQWLCWTQTPKCRCCTWILNIFRRWARAHTHTDDWNGANKKSLILDRKVVALGRLSAYFRRLFTLRLIFYDKRWIWIAFCYFCMVIKYECVANKEMNSIHLFEILLSMRVHCDKKNRWGIEMLVGKSAANERKSWSTLLNPWRMICLTSSTNKFNLARFRTKEKMVV